MAAKKTKKKKIRKSSTKSDGSAALELARSILRKKPSASFGDIKAVADRKKITIWPITYGRAKALEGLVTVAAYGAKKKAAGKRGPGRPKGSKNKVKRGPGRPKGSKNKVQRGPGRPRKAPMSGLDSIESLVTTIKTLQRERDDAIRAIDKIRGLLASL